MEWIICAILPANTYPHLYIRAVGMQKTYSNKKTTLNMAEHEQKKN